MPDPDTTLEELEGAWPDPGHDATTLVRGATLARRLPIGQLSVEHLRLLIGQDIALDVLVPLAVDRLAGDPLAGGDLYPGDLLAAVLRLPSSWWADHVDSAGRLRLALAAIDPDDPDLAGNPDLAAAVAAF